MEILSTNCAGLDVHKQTVKACLLTRSSDGQLHKEFRTYSTTTGELLKLCDWLKEQGCTHVAFEATGVYWKPVFNEARKAVLNCWWSMHTISKPYQGARPMSKMRNGSPICCNMACSNRASFPLVPSASCGN
jgi:hypothetical protein